MPQEPLGPRKQPKQARSRQMRADILEAALRVLADVDPRRFTMVRIAAVAGISIGSLYQYYPDKESLLVALHEREVEAAWAEVAAILAARGLAPRERVERTVTLFFRREAAEPPAMQHLMNVAARAARDSPRHQAVMTEARRGLAEFMAEVVAGDESRPPAFLVDVFVTTVTGVGLSIADRGLTPPEVDRWARTCSDMLCGYLGLR